jgi:hypothetical protein
MRVRAQRQHLRQATLDEMRMQQLWQNGCGRGKKKKKEEKRFVQSGNTCARVD